jgi:hypothetical protein
MSVRDERLGCVTFQSCPFCAGAISLISMSSTASGIEWSCTREWNLLHLAVKHDVECLKLLLYTLQQRLDSDTMDQILAARDSRYLPLASSTVLAYSSKGGILWQSVPLVTERLSLLNVYIVPFFV